MRAERPSKLQQNHLGMESNASSPLDVAAVIGAEGTIAVGDSAGRRLRRAVSFLGPGQPASSVRFSNVAEASRLVAGSDKLSGGPVGLGRGRRITGDGGGDRRGGMTGAFSGCWGSAL